MSEQQETQETVGRWMDETFPGIDPESPRKSIRALEEMVELCLASGADAMQMMEAVKRGYNAAHDNPKSPYVRLHQPDKIAAEAADVLIVLYGVAHMRGFDLHAEVDRKMAINRARRWKANGDGTGYHIKSGADTMETQP
jgi:NTP pyrophosphatase (non-canonical NTP hydrolase)